MKAARAGRRAAVVAGALAVFAVPVAAAATPPSIVVENGVTQPVFGYTDAIRERVRVDAAFEDYVFEAGHQIGVVIVGSYAGYSSIADQTRANITVSGRFSKLLLPIVGGKKAALAAPLARHEGPVFRRPLRARSGCPDLNWGPLRPERSALPGCATPRARTG
jgi:hypothetical protein